MLPQPPASSTLLPVEFSTAPLPPRLRFEAYRAWTSSWFDVCPPPGTDGPPGDFRVRTAAWNCGRLAVVRSDTLDPSVNLRAAARARRDMLDHWGIQVLRSGHTRATVGDVETRASPGQAHLFGLHQPTRNERTAVRSVMLYIARDAVSPDLAEALDARLGQDFGDVMGNLFRANVDALPEVLAAGLTVEEGAAAAAATLALLRAAAMGRAAALRVDDAVGELALAGAEGARVMALIRRHLADPNLRPEGLERLAGLSRGRLYALLEREGGVARAIQRERLRVAARALSDRADRRPIAAIAEAVGLPDATVFSRAFRREFGETPREWRERASLGLQPPGAWANVGAARDVYEMLRGLGRG